MIFFFNARISDPRLIKQMMLEDITEIIHLARITETSKNALKAPGAAGRHTVSYFLFPTLTGEMLPPHIDLL